MTLQIQVVLTALLTSFLTGIFTYLAAWGLLPGLDVGSVSSALASGIATAIIAAGSAWYAGYITKKSSVISAAAAQPEVCKIVTDKATADAAPSTKVVSE